MVAAENRCSVGASLVSSSKSTLGLFGLATFLSVEKFPHTDQDPFERGHATVFHDVLTSHMPMCPLLSFSCGGKNRSVLDFIFPEAQKYH